MMSNVNEAKTVNKDLPIQWNLYEADTLGECCSVRLIQGVRLIQVSIDNVREVSNAIQMNSGNV